MVALIVAQEVVSIGRQFEGESLAIVFVRGEFVTTVGPKVIEENMIDTRCPTELTLSQPALMSQRLAFETMLDQEASLFSMSPFTYTSESPMQILRSRSQDLLQVPINYVHSSSTAQVGYPLLAT